MPATLQEATLAALPLADLAVRWGCSTTTIRRKVSRGLLPKIQLPGSPRILIPNAAIIDAEQSAVVDQPAPASNFI